MATAFSATLIQGPTMTGPDKKEATYLLAWPSTYVAGGMVMDVSGEFNYVTGVGNPGYEVVADANDMDSVVLVGTGTYSAGNGYPAATITLAGYNAGTEVSGDISSIANMTIVVFGK